MLCIFIFLFSSCQTSLSPEKSSVKYLDSKYTFNIDNDMSTNEKKPFASLSNDTLVITDYWLMMENSCSVTPLVKIPEFSGDTILIGYGQKANSDYCSCYEGFVPYPQPTSIKTEFKFIVYEMHKTIYVKINSVPFAMSPDSIETHLGFRYAGEPILEKIRLDSL